MNEHGLSALMRETATAAGDGRPVGEVLTLVGKARNTRRLRGAVGAAVAVAAVLAVVQAVVPGQPAASDNLIPASPEATPTATHAPSDEPELGTAAVPAAVHRTFDTAGITLAEGTADVLARSSAESALVLYGVVTADGASCVVTAATGPGDDEVVFGWSCESEGRAADRVVTERLTGPSSTSVIFGIAPTGAVEARLQGDGRLDRVQLFAGGTRWQDRTFFIAPWPYATAVQIGITNAAGESLGEALLPPGEDRA